MIDSPFNFQINETVFVPYKGKTSMNGPVFESGFVKGRIGDQHAYFSNWVDEEPTGFQVEIIPDEECNVSPFWVGYSIGSKPTIFKSQEEAESFIQKN